MPRSLILILAQCVRGMREEFKEKSACPKNRVRILIGEGPFALGGAF